MIKDVLDVYYFVYDNGIEKIPADWQVTKNFTWQEVFTNEVNRDGYPLLEVFRNAAKTARVLQKVRDALKRPIVVHCWVRQIPHNKRVGSTAKRSAHLNGCAVDFHVQGMGMEAARKAILKLDLPLRVEAGTPTWVHVDTGNEYIGAFKYGLFTA